MKPVLIVTRAVLQSLRVWLGTLTSIASRALTVLEMAYASTPVMYSMPAQGQVPMQYVQEVYTHSPRRRVQRCQPLDLSRAQRRAGFVKRAPESF